jgi:hypothetical protein
MITRHFNVLRTNNTRDGRKKVLFQRDKEVCSASRSAIMCLRGRASQYEHIECKPCVMVHGCMQTRSDWQPCGVPLDARGGNGICWWTNEARCRAMMCFPRTYVDTSLIATADTEHIYGRVLTGVRCMLLLPRARTTISSRFFLKTQLKTRPASMFAKKKS